MKKATKEQRIAFPLCIGAIALVLLFLLIENAVFLEWFFSTFLMLVASMFLIKPAINHITRKHNFDSTDAVFIFIGIFSWAAYVLIAGQTLYDSIVLFLQQLFIASVLITLLNWITCKERED
jgi:hypothetical protein